MTVSPTGANKFEKRGFKSKQGLNNHWAEHGHQYPGFTREQYEKRSLELVESAVGGKILGHTDKDDVVVRYDKEANDFVKGKPPKGVFTMFKPEDGAAYYQAQREEDLKHGGKA